MLQFPDPANSRDSCQNLLSCTDSSTTPSPSSGIQVILPSASSSSSFYSSLPSTSLGTVPIQRSETAKRAAQFLDRLRQSGSAVSSALPKGPPEASSSSSSSCAPHSPPTCEMNECEVTDACQTDNGDAGGPVVEMNLFMGLLEAQGGEGEAIVGSEMPKFLQNNNKRRNSSDVLDIIGFGQPRGRGSESGILLPFDVKSMEKMEQDRKEQAKAFSKLTMMLLPALTNGKFKTKRKGSKNRKPGIVEVGKEPNEKKKQPGSEKTVSDLNCLEGGPKGKGTETKNEDEVVDLNLEVTKGEMEPNSSSKSGQDSDFDDDDKGDDDSESCHSTSSSSSSSSSSDFSSDLPDSSSHRSHSKCPLIDIIADGGGRMDDDTIPSPSSSILSSLHQCDAENKKSSNGDE